jgi:hypothetical protein
MVMVFESKGYVLTCERVTSHSCRVQETYME